jgi:hypothetical protein
MTTASCRGCGASLDEELDRRAGARVPCPHCGSTDRAFAVHLTDGVAAGDYWKREIKLRRAGKGRPYIEEVDGDDLWRKTGRWMHLTRTIDRANNWYSKRIVDLRTGEVVYRCEEPLSAHRGRGSAQNR